MGLGQLWEVKGGGSSTGILVREGQKLASKELPERLAKHAVVEELELAGERLRFRRIKGDGPDGGWVSIRAKGADLLVQVTLPDAGGPEDFGDKLVQVLQYEDQKAASWADAMGEVGPTGEESPHKDDPEWKKELKREFKTLYEASVERVGDTLGRWRALVPWTHAGGDGPLHICCLCCAETGHLTPMIRVARGLAARSSVRKVTFVSNTFGASKVDSWLKSTPDSTGKITLVTFEDAWTLELQDRCNWFAQEEDGSLLGISNLGIGKHVAPLLQTLVAGKDPPQCWLVDIASGGYSSITHQTSIPALTNCPITILGAPMLAGDQTILLHCFNTPMLAPMLAAIAKGKKPGAGLTSAAIPGPKDMTEAPTELEVAEIMKTGGVPENVIPVGIIADEAKLGEMPAPLVEFLDRPGPVVYVSMGSVATFTKEQLAMITEALRAPGEWRVIWSLKAQQQVLLPGGGPESLGEDFHVSTWLPQAELLQHKKVVAFLSHCGWGATCEAIISAKPVIAFPMFADQLPNALLMEIFGMAKTVAYEAFDPMQIVADPKGKDMKAMMSRLEFGARFVRDNFTVEGLKEDIRTLVTQKSFLGAAKRARTTNRTFGGGAGKAAEEVDKFCYKHHPGLAKPREP